MHGKESICFWFTRNCRKLCLSSVSRIEAKFAYFCLGKLLISQMIDTYWMRFTDRHARTRFYCTQTLALRFCCCAFSIESINCTDKSLAERYKQCKKTNVDRQRLACALQKLMQNYKITFWSLWFTLCSLSNAVDKHFDIEMAHRDSDNRLRQRIYAESIRIWSVIKVGSNIK